MSNLSTELVKRARRRLLEMHFNAGVGHLGGNLSALDALLVLHHQVMGPEDVFVLAKGHAAGALYITLWSLAKLSDEDLNTFHRDGTFLAGHPVAGWSNDIPFATGSLGHGLPDAAGMALGYKLQSQASEVFCLTSDGEWQEGSNWEAAMSAAHFELSNLVVIVDRNRLQLADFTHNIMDLEPLDDKFKAFGFEVHDVNGNEVDKIWKLIENLDHENRKPKVIIANTIKGRGVSFMENVPAWHHKFPDEDQLKQALRELEDA